MNYKWLVLWYHLKHHLKLVSGAQISKHPHLVLSQQLPLPQPQHAVEAVQAVDLRVGADGHQERHAPRAGGGAKLRKLRSGLEAWEKAGSFALKYGKHWEIHGNYSIITSNSWKL